ncbi:PREDICTED: tumor necrosis factor receptor superfamily member 1A [Cyprinodon variegatus]|uniref:Tumor necrosis factor receptor superfamily, member 1a n=1 Tax=Cyprinodon variegatus TaxID=28743 RepID=A0A3Q2FC52_CYPVA|nr:PREDICTED: tumor necrosis factor receptor superfamily member 1A [Cyprinodon variegatus]
MDGIGNQAGCIVMLLLLLLRSIPVLTMPQEKDECPPGEYKTDKGICCNKCARGFKLADECHFIGHKSNCVPCDAGQFLDEMSFSKNCRSCKRCKAKKHEHLVSACKPEADTICQCDEGYFKYRIDTEAYDCLRCRTCKTDEIQKKPCTHENDTVCECRTNFFRVKNTCKPCSSCTPECTQLCSTTGATKAPHPYPDLTGIIIGTVVMVVVLLILGIIITHMATKRFVKKKMRSQSLCLSEESKEQSKDFLINAKSHPEEMSVKTVVENSLGEQELCKLPDCVPMIPDLIYTVLDLVPVHQVKQLVRSLGVTDMEIEQAEMDHRFCREAHYQMLRVWAQGGSRTIAGVKGETVHQSLLDELLDKLRQIHLNRAAEELEAKYTIQ